MDGSYRDEVLVDGWTFARHWSLGTIGLSLFVLLLFGLFASRLVPVVRTIGMALGGLFFVGYIGTESLEGGIEVNSIRMTLFKASVLAAIVVGFTWSVLPFIYPFFQFLQLVLIWLFQKPPYSHISFSEPFRPFLLAPQRRYAGMVNWLRERHLRRKNDKLIRQRTAERTIQQAYACEHEARETLQELLIPGSLSTHPNAETQLKWLRRAREKASLDHSDDPIAFGEALERMDDDIKGLEGQLELSKRTPEIDLPLLDAAISRRPKNAALYIERGNYYFKMAKDSRKALADFKHSLILLPGYAAANHAIGMVYSDLKRYRDATKHFQDALRFDPDCSAAHKGLAEVRKKGQGGLAAWIGRLVAFRTKD